MANPIAEIIDLKTYRERKAEECSAEKDAGAFAGHFGHGQAPMSFAMPVAFFVFWPTWVFAPPFAPVMSEGGSGAA